MFTLNELEKLLSKHKGIGLQNTKYRFSFKKLLIFVVSQSVKEVITGSKENGKGK